MTWAVIGISLVVLIVTLVIVAKEWGEARGEAEANRDVAKRMKAYEDIDQEPDTDWRNHSNWMQ